MVINAHRRLSDVMKVLHIGIMCLVQMKLCLTLAFCLSFHNLWASSSFISDADSGARILDQRRLLQARKSCPVDFEHQNYTLITSQCKGPNYSPKLCCSSFIVFACPFADELNDLSNDCSIIMFSYIKRIGKYPDGLFSSLCRDGRYGLDCPTTTTTTKQPVSMAGRNGGGAGIRTAMMIMVNVVLVMLLV